jgi:hypothetical protein
MNAFKNWYLNSETVLWARIQLLLGAIWTVLAGTDMTAVIPPKWQPWFIPIWLMLNGIITEILRRSNVPVVSVTKADPVTGDTKPVIFLGTQK